MRSFTNKGTTLNVNTFNGSLTLSVSDMVFPGRGMSLTFQRYYNSFLLYSPLRPNDFYALGWTFDFDEYLYFDEFDGSISFYPADMTNVYRFTKENGTYKAYGDYNKLALTDNKDGSLTVSYLSGLKKIFDSQTGCIIRIRDNIGNEIKYVWVDYSGENRISKIIDTSGRALNFSYTVTPSSRTLTITDWADRDFTYKYKLVPNSQEVLWLLESYTDPEGNVTSYNYHTVYSMLESITFPEGTWVRTTKKYPRPDDVRVASLSFADGLTVDYLYDWPTRTTTVRAGDRIYIYEHDQSGNLISYTDPLNNVTTYTHDSAGRILTITDPRLGVTSYTYNPSTGMRTSTTDALGNQTINEYNDPNWPTKPTKIRGPAPFNYETKFTYDPDTGNMLSMTDRLGKITRYTYYDSGYRKGLLYTVTDPNGKTTSNDYGFFGDLTSVTNPLGKTTSFARDLVGNVIQTTDALGNKSFSEYDKNNNVMKMTDALGNVTRIEYDGNQNQVSITDANNRTTQSVYDESNRLVQVIDAPGNKVEYTHDIYDNIIAISDSNGHVTTMENDAGNRVTKITDPLGRETSFLYDPYCNTDTKIDANGHSTKSFFNLLCNLTKKMFNEGSYFQYTRDNLQRITEVIQPGKCYGDFKYGDEKYGYNPNDKILYEWDAMDRLTKITYPGNKFIEFTYDDGGRLSSITDINGEVTSFGYDDANRLTSVTHGGATTNYTWDDANRLTQISYPNGVTGTFTYNARGDLIRILWTNNSGTLYDINYTVDSVGNRVRKTVVKTPDPLKKDDYVYDALYRLAGVYRDGALSSRYTFDPMGNRLLKRTASSTEDYDYDACDEMSFAGDVSFKYDLKGRLVSSYDPSDNAERGYVWSYDDRLLYINFPDGTKSTMKYNHEGLRTYRKDKSGNVTNYYWSTLGLPQVLNETDGAGNPRASYVLGLGLIAIKVSGVKKYYIHDGLRSVLALTDGAGNVTDTYEYSDYGETTASTGSSYNPYRFTGQQYDADSGMYYLRARYYDPSTGRFISSDSTIAPIKSHQYVNNDPINYVDPTGYAGIPASPEGSTYVMPSVIPPKGLDQIDANIEVMHYVTSIYGSGFSLNVPGDLLTIDYFVSQVKPKGTWDYAYHNDAVDFGNFNFGATGMAAGYPEEVLLRAAGFVHSGSISKALGPPPYGDTENGQFWIKQGIEYYKAHYKNRKRKC